MSDQADQTYAGQRPGRLVVGVDGSPAATRALMWAAREASSWGRVLHIVHAPDLRWVSEHGFAQTVLNAARSLLEEATDQVKARYPDVPVTISVHPERLADGALVSEAEPEDVLVVGSRGLGGFSGLLLGSVSLRVAACARGPVVVVRGTEPPAPRGVVVAGVRDEGDFAALRFAAETARHRGTCLQVTFAWRLVEQVGAVDPRDAGLPDLSDPAENEAMILEGLVEDVRRQFPGLPVTQGIVRAFSPAGALVEASALADLLVLGARRPGSRILPRLGRVTHAVLHHARCPVAVVPCEQKA